METYCLKCKKYTENIDPKISSISNTRVMILSKSVICGSKGIKTPLNKIPILADILF